MSVQCNVMREARMKKDFCYLAAAVGLNDGAFDPMGYDSSNGGHIRVDGVMYDFVDPDARCDKLYDDLIDFYDMTDCKESLYSVKFKKEKVGSLLVLTDEYGNKMSSDYIGPSPHWAHVNGGMNDSEIGKMLLCSRTIGGHMLWPVHKIPTINTSRGGKNGFYDRIDLTLQEIRYMMTGSPQFRNKQVRRAVENESAWFELFKGENGLESFKRFIDTFHLKPFVFGTDYKVVSLAQSDIEKGFYVEISPEEPVFPKNFRKYVDNNLTAIEMRGGMRNENSDLEC